MKTKQPAMTATAKNYLFELNTTVRGFPFIVRVYDVEIWEGTYSPNAPSDIDYYGYEETSWVLGAEDDNGDFHELIDITAALTPNEDDIINELVVTEARHRRRAEREEYEADARFGAFDDIPW